MTIMLYFSSGANMKSYLGLKFGSFNPASGKFCVDFLLQEEVRRHFGCDLLEGAELEDQGILGTALTHWEKRVFEVKAHVPPSS